MAWIELHDTLPDHGKVLSVAEALKMDKDLVVGKLVRLWTWALNNRENGVFKEQDISTIAEVMRFRGKPQRLVDALVSARLLDIVGDTYIIHDWEERVGMLLAKRETVRLQTRERVKRHREKSRNAENVTDAVGCNALQERYSNAISNACNAATIPYHTVPYHDDEEDDEDDNIRAHTREFNSDYAEAERLVCAAYKNSYGREPTASEVSSLARIAVMEQKVPLIAEAINRAAVFGAKSVVSYVGEIIKEWRYQQLDTMDELAEYDYLKDCINGKITTGIPPEEAIKRLRENRDEKKKGRRAEDK